MKQNFKTNRTYVILVVFALSLYAYHTYQKNKTQNEIQKELKVKGCSKELEGFVFGITKKEFEKKYPGYLDSMKYKKNEGYFDYHKLITSFHGIKVKSSQFVFTKGLFSRIMINSEEITRNNFDELNKHYQKFDKISSYSFNHEDSSRNENTYKVNDCLDVTLGYNLMDLTDGKKIERIYISFGIDDELMEQYTY